MIKVIFSNDKSHILLKIDHLGPFQTHFVV